MKNKNPRILLIDIENTPMISYTWGRWEQNVVDVKQESYILSFAYKWLGDKKTHVLTLPAFKGYKPGIPDDKNLLLKVHDLFNEADIIVAQNGDNFDIKKINTRFIFHGLKPVEPYKTVDTLKVAKKYFSFSSNSLNELGKFLGLGEKKETHGFKTWLGCMKGDKKSWAVMESYNAMDVKLLERIYLKLLPFIKNHPPYGIYNGKKCCANCGSENVIVRGYGCSKTRRYQKYECKACGAYSSSTIGEKEEKPLVGI